MRSCIKENRVPSVEARIRGKRLRDLGRLIDARPKELLHALASSCSDKMSYAAQLVKGLCLLYESLVECLELPDHSMPQFPWSGFISTAISYSEYIQWFCNADQMDIGPPAKVSQTSESLICKTACWHGGKF